MPTPKPDASPLGEAKIEALRRDAVTVSGSPMAHSQAHDKALTVLALLAEREEARRLLEEANAIIQDTSNRYVCDLRVKILAHLDGNRDGR